MKILEGAQYDTAFLNAPNQSTFARYGSTWTADERATLVRQFLQGCSLKELCVGLQRPASGVLGKLAEASLLRYETSTGCYFYTARAERHSPSPSSIPTSKETTMSAIVIENNTTVNGKNIKEMSDSELYSLIAQQEACIEKLSAIKHKPRRLQDELTKRQQGIEALVALLDAQG